VLVTLVAAKENCFQEVFKTIKAVHISKFIRQQVPDCQAGIVERPTAVRAELTARHSETVQVRSSKMLARAHQGGTDRQTDRHSETVLVGRS